MGISTDYEHTWSSPEDNHIGIKLLKREDAAGF